MIDTTQLVQEHATRTTEKREANGKGEWGIARERTRQRFTRTGTMLEETDEAWCTPDITQMTAKTFRQREAKWKPLVLQREKKRLAERMSYMGT